MSLVLDLILNHVAREHAWACAARAGDTRYRGYFYIYPIVSSRMRSSGRFRRYSLTSRRQLHL